MGRDSGAVCEMLALTKHMGCHPYTGAGLPLFPKFMERHGDTTSALHTPIDKLLPQATVRQLIRAKLAQT